MASGFTRKGARGRRSSTKQTAGRKKTGVVTTGAQHSKPALRTRTSGTVATGKTSTRPRPSKKEKALMHKVVEVKPVSARYVTKERGGEVSPPFWSDAMKAMVIEYREPDPSVPGGWWESRIYASSEEHAATLHRELQSVTTRKMWMDIGHKAAKTLAVMQGNGFLYRTMMGERAERLREKGV